MSSPQLDVCFIAEGSYPYVAGGVSSWIHDIILAQPDLKFGIISLLPDRTTPHELRYEIPSNVHEFKNIYLQEIKQGASKLHNGKELYNFLYNVLTHLQQGNAEKPIDEIVSVFYPLQDKLGSEFLLNSHEAWEILIKMYEDWFAGSSFIDYFWSWRALVGGLYATMIEDYPKANVYHSVSTGYAGILGVRATLETGRPLILTEHGIYTNERRIELTMADWLHEKGTETLGLQKTENALQKMWTNVFYEYAKSCYAHCNEIITLYEGNQKFQIADGADPQKTSIIPNGVEYESFAAITPKEKSHPTIALIGRVVPIKDIKTFVRSVGQLAKTHPDLEALIMGPYEEDMEYYEECKLLIESLSLQNIIKFTGRVRLVDYMDQIDVVVLTSVSEALPLVLLEAGSAAIPVVSTDVGACSEILYGQKTESPALGAGGAIVPLASPMETANAIAELLGDEEKRKQAGKNLQTRVKTHYNKKVIDAQYRALYDQYRK